MTRATLGRKPHPLLRRYLADAAVPLGTVAFLVVVTFVGLWLLHSC